MITKLSITTYDITYILEIICQWQSFLLIRQNAYFYQNIIWLHNLFSVNYNDEKKCYLLQRLLSREITLFHNDFEEKFNLVQQYQLPNWGYILYTFFHARNLYLMEIHRFHIPGLIVLEIGTENAVGHFDMNHHY